MNPKRRPTRRIYKDAGRVASAVPTMTKVTGMVARAGDGAMDKAISGLVRMTMVRDAPNRVWQMARIRTFFRSRDLLIWTNLGKNFAGIGDGPGNCPFPPAGSSFFSPTS